MGRLFEEHEGWTCEELDEMFGPHPDHVSAPTRAELEAELASDSFDWSIDDLDKDEPSLTGWTSLSDDEIKTAVRRICQASRSDQEVQDRLRDELGYPYGNAAVSSMDCGPMRMSSVMLHGSRGNTISI